MQQRHNQKKGFNLIEAAIVLGVVGLVVGGIWWAAASFSSAQKINQTLDGLKYYQEHIKNLYYRLPKPNNYMPNHMFDFPSGFYQKKYTLNGIITPFGNMMVIFIGVDNPLQKDFVRFRFHQGGELSVEICNKLGAMIWSIPEVFSFQNETDMINYTIDSRPTDGRYCRDISIINITFSL